MKKEKVRMIVEKKLNEIERKIDSVEEAVSNIEDAAMDLTGVSNGAARKHGRNLLKMVNKVHASDMDPAMLYKLMVWTRKAVKDLKEFSLFPSYAYLRRALENGEYLSKGD